MKILVIDSSLHISKKTMNNKQEGCKVKRYSSDKADSSITWAMSEAFIHEYKKNNPKVNIEFLNLNNLKMANTTLNSNNVGTYYNKNDCDFHINQLKNVDKVIITAPNINSMYPAILKNYLDHIIVAKKTFSYDKNGKKKGGLSNLTVQIIAAQGSPLEDSQKPMYVVLLEDAWRFMGSNVKETLILAETAMPQNVELSPVEIVDHFKPNIEIAAYKF